MFANSKMRENCGRLIKVYREMRHASSKDHQYNCSEFILAAREHPFFEVAEGQPVCSRATLNRMERGLSVRDDELYEFFIGKLGFRASEFPGVIEQAEKLGKELYSAVELYDVSKIEQLDKQIDTLFEKARNYFYYNEVYTALKTVTDYYLNAGYPKNADAYRIFDTNFLFASEISELVSNILFDYFYFYKNDLVVSEQISDRLVTFKNEAKLSSFYISAWCMYKERWLDALCVINEAITYFSVNKIKYHLGILYFAKALALHSGNKDNVKLYFDRSILCLQEIPGMLAEKKLFKNYYNVGFHYYFDKEYNEALKYFKKYLSYNPPFTIHMIYILHCTEILNTDELQEDFRKIELDESKDNEACKVLYKYFVMKINKTSEKEIEKYIMDEVYELLTHIYRSANLINYFEFELNQLVKVTKCYKDLTNFNFSISHKID